VALRFPVEGIHLAGRSDHAAPDPSVLLRRLEQCRAHARLAGHPHNTSLISPRALGYEVPRSATSPLPCGPASRIMRERCPSGSRRRTRQQPTGVTFSPRSRRLRSLDRVCRKAHAVYTEARNKRAGPYATWTTGGGGGLSAAPTGCAGSWRCLAAIHGALTGRAFHGRARAQNSRRSMRGKRAPFALSISTPTPADSPRDAGVSMRAGETDL
jgi:hypothetical protein